MKPLPTGLLKRIRTAISDAIWNLGTVAHAAADRIWDLSDVVDGRDLTRNADPSPYHAVQKFTGKHLGPFTTPTDALLAVSLVNPLDWNVLNRDQFDLHLKAQPLR